MLGTLKKIGLAAAVAVAFGLSAAPASAWDGHYGYGVRHHHFRHHAVFFRHHAFYRPRFVVFRARAFASDCFVRRVVRFNRFGERVVVIRRVCY
jgi:hypothetical protein